MCADCGNRVDDDQLDARLSELRGGGARITADAFRAPGLGGTLKGVAPHHRGIDRHRQRGIGQPGMLADLGIGMTACAQQLREAAVGGAVVLGHDLRSAQHEEGVGVGLFEALFEVGKLRRDRAEPREGMTGRVTGRRETAAEGTISPR